MRYIQVLIAVANANNYGRVGQVSIIMIETGIPRSTAYRIMGKLLRVGLVRKGGNGGYLINDCWEITQILRAAESIQAGWVS